MRRILLSMSLLFLFYSKNHCLEVPDTIIVKTNRVKGYGPFAQQVASIMTMGKENPWRLTIPVIKGIPDYLDGLMFCTYQTDFLQHTYQSFHAGKITAELYASCKNAWSWEPDSSEYSKEFVKVDIAIAAGFDNEGKLRVIVDKNNNYDLSDDDFYIIPKKLPGQNYWGRYNDLLPFEVTYEYFDGNKIQETTAWVYIDYSSGLYHSPDNNLPIELSIDVAQHHLGDFTFGNKKYTVALKGSSSRATFRSQYTMKVWETETNVSKSGFDDGIEKGGIVRLGDYYYKFVKASVDGKYITLAKESSVEERGGNQVGLKAINFSAKSIDGKLIQLDELRGKYVYLDFWGTWCAPCVEEIPTLKKIYATYKNKDLVIIGIANDHIEALTSFIHKHKLEWPQIIQSENKSIINLYGVTYYPTTFFIDPKGTIIEKDMKGEELEKRLKVIFKNE